MKHVPQKINQEKYLKNQRKITDTKNRIFPYQYNEGKNFKKIKRTNKNNYDHLNDLGTKNKTEIRKLESKPCNNDFKRVSEEAKNNLNKRYYFDNTTSIW